MYTIECCEKFIPIRQTSEVVLHPQVRQISGSSARRDQGISSRVGGRRQQEVCHYGQADEGV